MIFLEDQIIEGIKSGEKKKNTAADPINFNPIFPPTVHDNYGGEVQDERNGATDQKEPANEPLKQDEQVEEVPF